MSYTGVVRVWLDLPDAVVEQLAEKGQDLSRAALEALAIDAYRTRRISGYQLRQLLALMWQSPAHLCAGPDCASVVVSGFTAGLQPDTTYERRVLSHQGFTALSALTEDR